MVFVCCICHEDLARKKSTGDDGGEKNKSQQEQPIVTTKCGHLFHSSCLKSWFQKKGTEVWTTRDCPVCQMSLTVATDLIRIFPSSEDDTGPSIEDFKNRIAKLENANATLTSHLEMSFIRSREQEKKITQKTKENEQLQKAYVLEKTKGSQFQMEASKLKHENDELRNVIIALNKTLAAGVNGLGAGNAGGPYGPYSDRRGPGPAFQPSYGSKHGFQQFSGSSQSFGNGISGRAHHQSANPSGGWVPSKPINNIPNNGSQSNIEIREGIALMSLNKSQALELSNIKSCFPSAGEKGISNGAVILKSIGGGEPEQEKTRDEISSSVDANSHTSSETGEIKPEHLQRSSLENSIGISGVVSGRPAGSVVAEATRELQKMLPAHADFPDLNGNPVSMQNIVKDETPTDELMDAILKSKPQVPGRNDGQLLDANFVTKDTKKIRGKTKWKVVDYEDNSDKKIYGKFCCQTCNAKWGTARHVLNKPQTCLQCNEIVFPYAQGPVMTKEELAQEKMNRKRKQ